MSKISSKNISEAIYLSLENKSSVELPDTIAKIVKFLSRKRLLSKSKEILKYLENKINKEKGVLVVKIFTAKKIEENLRIDLKSKLKQKYNANEIILIENIDEKLVNGIKIEIEDEIIDLTIRKKLNTLQEYLIKNA